jgi:CRP-like cAMP-binding protein
MTAAQAPTLRVGNRLLDHLPPEHLEHLLPKLEEISLAMKEVVSEPGQPITHVLFPLSGVISLLTVTEDGGTVEVTTVGNEGMVGVAVFLGAGWSTTRTLCQVPGRSIRIEAKSFRSLVDGGGPLKAVIHRYAAALLSEISQNTACNRLHTNEERMARWLLMNHDRVGSDDFPMTHEFLSQMLGVRRATVTVSAGILQQAGLIRSRRGHITIVDRDGLEASSCECYRVIRAEFARLLE